MGNSKVILGEEVLIDLTADTITADKLFDGVTAHDAAGNPITGTMGAPEPWFIPYPRVEVKENWHGNQAQSGWATIVYDVQIDYPTGYDNCPAWLIYADKPTANGQIDAWYSEGGNFSKLFDYNTTDTTQSQQVYSTDRYWAISADLSVFPDFVEREHLFYIAPDKYGTWVNLRDVLKWGHFYENKLYTENGLVSPGRMDPQGCLAADCIGARIFEAIKFTDWSCCNYFYTTSGQSSTVFWPMHLNEIIHFRNNPKGYYDDPNPDVLGLYASPFEGDPDYPAEKAHLLSDCWGLLLPADGSPAPWEETTLWDSDTDLVSGERWNYNTGVPEANSSCLRTQKIDVRDFDEVRFPPSQDGRSYAKMYCVMFDLDGEYIDDFYLYDDGENPFYLDLHGVDTEHPDHIGYVGVSFTSAYPPFPEGVGIKYGEAEPVIQPTKTVRVTENGTQSIKPDQGFTAIGAVDLTVDVPQDTPELQTKSVTYSSNGAHSITPDYGYDGLDEVNVTVDVDVPTLQANKAQTINSNSTVTINPDSGYDGMEQATVTVSVPVPSVQSTKSQTITQNGTVNITPDSGYDALAKLALTVNVSGGSANIKTGTTSTTTSTSSTNIKITDTSTIGFTPKAFIMWLDGSHSTTRYMVNDSMFITQGSSYMRHTNYRGSSADSYLNATTSWTTQTNGYLYFASNTVYFRNNTSYRIATGTYRWIALTW